MPDLPDPFALTYPRIEFQDGPNRYLVALDGTWGRILDRARGKYYSVGRTVSMLVQGEWYDYTGPQDQLAEWIAACEDIEARLRPWQRWLDSPGWRPFGSGDGDDG